MTYEIDKSMLYGLVDAEVSRVADEAYSDDGTSLYDSVVLTSRDKGLVEGFIDDAISLFVNRTFDICKYKEPAQGSSNHSLEFDVPDFDATMEAPAKDELSRYISLYAANRVFQQRRAIVVPQYTERAQAAMDKAVTYLKSRKAPNESWS